MEQDHSWTKSAEGYDELYAEAMERVRRGDVPTLESVRSEPRPSREGTISP
jgi:hypothetical protein